MQRIAVGVDGSETSLLAAEFAGRLALETRAELAIITIPETLHFADQSRRQFADAEHLTAWGDLVDTYAQEILTTAKRRADRHHDIRVRTEWRAGPVAEQLAQFAREDRSDMLVVGHVGRGRIA